MTYSGQARLQCQGPRAITYRARTNTMQFLATGIDLRYVNSKARAAQLARQPLGIVA